MNKQSNNDSFPNGSFLTSYKFEMNLSDDGERAANIIGKVLGALRARISDRQSKELLQALPQELETIYSEQKRAINQGIPISYSTNHLLNLLLFIDRNSGSPDFDNKVEALEYLITFFALLKKRLPAAEYNKVLHIMPMDLPPVIDFGKRWIVLAEDNR